MFAPPLPRLTPVICGPTAGGKSDLAVQLALAARDRFGIAAEIITADAFQVYRGMDIGTAKPTLEEQRGIPHHLIDLVDAHRGYPAHRTRDRSNTASRGEQRAPTTSEGPFTVDDWLGLARAKIAELRQAGKLPIVVGGTHLYIKALLDGLFEGPEPSPALRAELASMDPAVRRAELERVDPAAAARIHPNDVRRTVRSLEVFRLTGRPISEHQKQWDSPTPAADRPQARFHLITLNWETEALNRRINARVKQMMDRGLLEEVRTLLAAGPLTAQAAEALGYKQLLGLGKPTSPWPPQQDQLDDAVERIKIETRRFAKNQRTWLRRLSATPAPGSGRECTPLHMPASESGLHDSGHIDRLFAAWQAPRG